MGVESFVCENAESSPKMDAATMVMQVKRKNNDLGLLLQHLDPTNLSSNTKAA